jgi:hypothetical protein
MSIRSPNGASSRYLLPNGPPPPQFSAAFCCLCALFLCSSTCVEESCIFFLFLFLSCFCRHTAASQAPLDIHKELWNHYHRILSTWTIRPLDFLVCSCWMFALVCLVDVPPGDSAVCPRIGRRFDNSRNVAGIQSFHRRASQGAVSVRSESGPNSMASRRSNFTLSRTKSRQP